jgi:hypothetical protein
MQNSKKEPHQQTEVKKGDKSVDQSNDEMQRKDQKNNAQQPNAKHQDASKDKDQAKKHTSSEDTSGAKNAQHDQHGKGKTDSADSHRGGSGQRSDDN